MARPKLLLLLAAWVLLFGLVACSTENGLTAEDFGVPNTAAGNEPGDPAQEAHDHAEDEPADHDHQEDETVLGGDGETLLDHHGQPIPEDIYEKFEEAGVSVEFTVEGFAGLGGRGTILNSDVAEGAHAAVKFNITDATTGQPLTGLRPAAWMDPHDSQEEHASNERCKEQVEVYLQGLLNARAQVDFNGFFILGMNEDATVSVIDPLANVGGMTQLYAMLLLKQPGEDWAIRADQEQVFITMPGANQVALLTTANFQIERDLDAGVRPVRVAFQPDQRYAWVGNDAERARESGVTVIDPTVPQVVAFIQTGRGHHELAFSADSRFAYVTNAEDGNLVVVETETLEVVEKVRLVGRPVALAVSAQGEIFVLDTEDGVVTVLDGDTYEERARLETGAGAAGLQFTPDGRWAIVSNPEQGLISLIEADSHTLTHVAPIVGGPDQISFSRNLAYVRLRDAAEIVTIPLAEIAADQALPLTTVPLGNNPPGQFPQLTTAGAMYPAADGAGLMVANPADGQVHYYVEGSGGALGSFEGHGRQPRAALIVDRSLHEEAPGVYVGSVRIPQDGEYEVAFFLGEPVLSHCFYFTAKPDPQAERAETLAPPELEFLSEPGTVGVGETVSLQFRLTNSASGEAQTNVQDAIGLLSPVSGIWQDRLLAEEVGEGVYELTLTLDEPGVYNLFFSVPSLGGSADQLPRLIIRVEAES